MQTRLEYQIRRPAEPAEAPTVAVLLHGRGSHMGDLQALAPALPPSWFVVTPQAPNAGSLWGYGPGWAWYRYIADDRVVEEALTESLQKLDGFLDDLPDIVGSTPDRIVLGGFSQGGTMSLAYALTHPGRVDAVWNFSGFLAASVDPAPGAATAPPIYWGHGHHDPAIPFPLAERGRTRLGEAGIPVSVGDFPIGHWIDPVEIRQALEIVPDDGEAKI
ncbi:MAG: alpha/beta fold hydrolase [Gemmatimonadota bacterium]